MKDSRNVIKIHNYCTAYDCRFIFHKSSRRLPLKGQGFSKMSCKGFLLCFLLLWVQKKHSWDLYDYRGLQHVAIDCRRAQHSTKILNVSIDVLVVSCCDEGIEGGCLG